MAGSGAVLPSLVLAVVAAIYVWLSHDYDLASRALPWMAGALALGLSLIDAVATARSSAGAPSPARHPLRQEAVAFAWIGAFLPLVVVLGFYAAILLYVFCYLRLHARKGGAASAATAALVAGFLYVVFDRLMGYEIFAGLLGGDTL